MNGHQSIHRLHTHGSGCFANLATNGLGCWADNQNKQSNVTWKKNENEKHIQSGSFTVSHHWHQWLAQTIIIGNLWGCTVPTSVTNSIHVYIELMMTQPLIQFEMIKLHVNDHQRCLDNLKCKSWHSCIHWKPVCSLYILKEVLKQYFH